MNGVSVGRRGRNNPVGIDKRENWRGREEGEVRPSWT